MIGVVDTGVQWDHPALQAAIPRLGRGAARWTTTTTGTTRPHLCDDSLTGTCDADYHIGDLPTATAPTSPASRPAGTAARPHIGVAPGARWIHAAACIVERCPTAAVLAALQWMLAPTDLAGGNPDPARRPQVVNNSWGGSGGSVIYDNAIAALRAAGIVPVFAAGNGGGLAAAR